MQIQGLVTTPGSNPVGSSPQVPAGKQGDPMFSELHGKWYQAAYAGKVFTGTSTITGTSFPIYTSTTGSFCLWNTSSTVNLELISFRLGWVSGTYTTGPLGYALITGAGSTIGGAISTFTNAPTYIRSGLAGTAGSGNASLANVTVTYVAPTISNMIPSNISGATNTLTNTGLAFMTMQEDFDGQLILPPGAAIQPVGLLASVSIFWAKFVWAEWPV
jgi:hypothetical protein